MKYKYSLIKDICIMIHTKKNMEFFDRENLFIIKWSFKRYVNFLYRYFIGKIEMPEIDGDYVCYFVSCGTWGAYKAPNIIYICPIFMENLNMSIKDLIIHEINHIKYESDVNGMTHKDRERHINNNTILD